MKRTIASVFLCAGFLAVGTGISAAQPATPVDATTTVASNGDCKSYWPSFYQVCGPIRDLYESLGGPAGTLGLPKSAETLDPDGIGKQIEFFGGTIRWTPSTGAYVI